MTLDLRQVSFGYSPKSPVLRAVNASFEPARLTAIIGPNGAGKSTLLRLLAALREPTEGSVTLDATALLSIPRAERAARLVYLPQQSTVAFDYTAFEVVAMGLYAHGHASGREPVQIALAEVGLSERADDPFSTLSAGQQQRVTLARALAQLGPNTDAKPRFLLADEPVSAMDPRHAIEAMTLLRSLASSGGSTTGGVGVVVVLHDLSLALRFADNAILLTSGGTLAAAGPVRDVLTRQHLEPLFGIAFETLLDQQRRPAAFIPATHMHDEPRTK